MNIDAVRTWPMSPAQSVLLALSLLLLGMLWRREHVAPPARNPSVPDAPCEVPVDWVGHGLLCLSKDAAARHAVRAGQRWSPDAPPTTQGQPERFPAVRGLLAGVRVDLRVAQEADLLALPNVGEVLVRNLATARRAGRLRCQSDLRAIPGLGPQRLRRLLRYMAPLPQVCHPAHPTQ